MSTHYSEFVLVFPAMELLIRRCHWYICKNQRMVSLDSVYDEALDAIHTIEPIVVNKWKVTEKLKKQGMVSPSSYYSEVLIAPYLQKNKNWPFLGQKMLF